MDRSNQKAMDAISHRIDRMPLAPWHGRLLAVLGGSNFFDAFDATALSFVLPVLVGLWHLTPVQVGLLMSASYAGQIFGSLGGGLLAERFGRISVLRAGLAAMAVISLACAFAPGYAVLLVLRLIQGLGLGCELPVAAAYMNETAPVRFRGKMVTAIQLTFGLGAFGASVFARILIPHFGWSSMFIAGASPILLAAVLRSLLPESPRWLAAKGRSQEAEAALSRIERAVFAGGAVPVLGPSAAPAALPAGTSATELSQGSIRALLKPPLLRSTLSAWLIAFCGSIVGYGIIGWMPTIYRTVYHLPIATALSYSIVTGAVSLPGAMLCLLVIDRLGRKPSLMLGFTGAAVLLAALAIVGSAISPFAVMVMASSALTFLTLPLAGFYVYTPELYPTSIRALGVGFAAAWARLAAIIGPPIIGMLLAAGPVRNVYIFFAAGSAIGALSTALLGIETRVRAPVIPHLASSKPPHERLV